MGIDRFERAIGLMNDRSQMLHQTFTLAEVNNTSPLGEASEVDNLTLYICQRVI